MDLRYNGVEASTEDLALTDALPITNDPEMAVVTTLLLWHSLDPPDDLERDRNDMIFTLQGNRNPFIDHPE